MEKRQIAISSSSEGDKGTLPKETPCSESAAVKERTVTEQQCSESKPCEGKTLTDQPVLSLWDSEREQVIRKAATEIPHSESATSEERDCNRNTPF
ncbi:hypothetical protein M9458_051852 [Cirrhinus mrigala]|uniref:Uncharacterized protein n=1 Tax=Cirrhinus mrigala TaxID=683832 RepID=A0ABD0MS20_CIRMR